MRLPTTCGEFSANMVKSASLRYLKVEMVVPETAMLRSSSHLPQAHLSGTIKPRPSMTKKILAQTTSSKSVYGMIEDKA